MTSLFTALESAAAQDKPTTEPAEANQTNPQTEPEAKPQEAATVEVPSSGIDQDDAGAERHLTRPPAENPGDVPESEVDAAVPAAQPATPASQPPISKQPAASDTVPPLAPKADSPDLARAGQQQYMLCGACHGQQGEGTAAAPPLAGSEWVNGPVENLIKIQLRGLIGPITVKGQEYNFPAGMVAMAYQTDEQIAGVLSYVRSSFGNDSSPVTPAQVAALRSEVGKPQVTVADLIQPETTSAPPTTESGAPLPIPQKYADVSGSIGLGLSPIMLLFLPILILVCVIAAFRK